MAGSRPGPAVSQQAQGRSVAMSRGSNAVVGKPRLGLLLRDKPPEGRGRGHGGVSPGSKLSPEDCFPDVDPQDHQR